MVHFCLFAVLAILAFASRWPIRRGLLAGFLLAFAVGTETLQALVPPRTVDPLDYVENLLGLATGAAIWCLASKWLGASRPQREGQGGIPGRESQAAESDGPEANRS